MTFGEAKKIFLDRGLVEVEGGVIFDGEKWREACYAISKWLKQEPCDDCISRQGVIDTLTKTGDIRGDALKALYDLPPVTPQPKSDVLDKIRAEIEQITDTMGVSYNQYVSKIDVLQIIDKYRESEVEDEN